jgi:hypothetical protein
MEDLNNEEVNNEVLVNDDSNNIVLGVDDTVTNVVVSEPSEPSEPSKCYEKDVKTKITEYQEDQGERIVQIKKSVETASKNKAILSLKYDSISFKISCIQISVIVFSALITFIETLNALYELHDFVGTVLPILFATYIAISLSIMRFFKMDETKETIGKTLENFSYIINKSRKTRHKIKNFDIDQSNLELWENLISNYENEIYDYMCNVRESYENILQYKDRVYYQRQLLNHYVENAFAHKNIDYVDKHWVKPHRDFEENLSTCDKIYRWFCCDKKNKIYYDYLNHLEELDKNSEETIENFKKHRTPALLSSV